MRTFSIVVSVICVTLAVFYALDQISQDNEYTSVRQYSKP